MKRFSAALALTALAAATLAVAQQAAPSAEPPASATSQQPSRDATTPSNPSTSASSETRQADKQALMQACVTQVTAANPGVRREDIQNFCDKEVNRSAPQK